MPQRLQDWDFPGIWLEKNNYHIRIKPNLLYVTENSNSPSCIRVLVQTEEGGEKSKVDMNSLK